ncbi:hypothetical protein MOQ_005990 [Trypanosoma cruzi marinkellei]|uniref:Trans-sialidase n=1 Tax=Trypanosoma cruzi marinkellei TaxID=85056 RepID=K2MT24_TRYCR|nr:hypothetical protein MOQ_005990 [Trypanosoma cruzi marinkellei]
MLHPIFQTARRNRREAQLCFSAKDARPRYDEPPTSPLWASYVRRANEVARGMWAPSTWEQRMSLAGNSKPFCRTHEQPMNEKSCVVLLVAIDVAQPTRLQYARMLRSMLQMDRTPLEMLLLVLQNIAAQSETKQVRPSRKKGMNQFIRNRTDWKQRVVVRLAWITASRWSEIVAVTPKNFTLEPDGNIILDWSVAPKTAKADPHRASRFVRVQGVGRFRHHTVVQGTSTQRMPTNLTTAHFQKDLWVLGMPRRVS